MRETKGASRSMIFALDRRNESIETLLVLRTMLYCSRNGIIKRILAYTGIVLLQLLLLGVKFTRRHREYLLKILKNAEILIVIPINFRRV